MTNYKIVAQNFDLEESVLTGKITCKHLYKAKVSGIIIGHPDTGEDIPAINKKLKEIISLTEKQPDALPFNVIMLGESLEEFNNNSLYDIALMLKEQCSTIFTDIPDSFIKQTLLIYEPKWLSNTDRSNPNLLPSPKLITQITNKMRDFLVERLGPDGFKVSLMYGEVSSPERAVEILKNENLQGLMLSSACNTVNKLLDIIKAIQYAYDKRKLILVCNFKSYEIRDYKEYIDTLDIFPDNFTIYFAPPYTELKSLSKLCGI